MAKSRVLGLALPLIIGLLSISSAAASDYVYQETEDARACEGTWDSAMPCSNAYDGSWSTAGRTVSYGTYSVLYLNYSKYPGSNAESLVRYFGANTAGNYSIPSDCWNANSAKLLFKEVSYGGSAGVGSSNYNQLNCWDGTQYVQIVRDQSLGVHIDDARLFETAMYWRMPATTTRRILPETAANSSNLTVKISMVVVNLSQASVGVTETFPSGWSLLNVTLGGIQRNNTLEWLFWPYGYPAKSQNITYTLLVPSTALGTYSFNGTISLGSGAYVNTQGDSQITIIAGCAMAGDYPPCETVTLDEVVTYINLWAEGQANLSNVVALITKWMAP